MQDKTVLLDDAIKKAIKYQEEGSLDKAELIYRKILQVRQDIPLVYNNLSVILKHKGQLEASESLVRKAIELDSNYDGAYASLAFLMVRKNNSKEAKALFLKAIKLCPSNGSYHNNLGKIYFEEGNTQKAVEHLSMALKINPDNANARKNLRIAKANLPDLVVKVGGDVKRAFNGTWYRGENTNFLPSKANLKEEDAIYEYILQGWLPGEPFISKNKTITTFGSCFAINVINFLKDKGYKVSGKDHAMSSHIIQCGEGIVNSFAILQQFEWAYEGKEFSEDLWHGSKGEVASYNSEIKEATRAIFDETEIFIITLGLSEVWYNKKTEDIFWRAIPQKQFNKEIHGFRNSTVEENRESLQRICDIIRKHKPSADIIFTLSPVPLNATFRPVSCLTANSVSKSVLRVAVDELIRNNLDDRRLFYFPSYEIVKEFYTDPYIEDNRHVKDEIVASIMNVFEKYYCLG